MSFTYLLIYFLSELIFKFIKMSYLFSFVITKSYLYFNFQQKKTILWLNEQKISSYLDYNNSLKSFSLD